MIDIGERLLNSLRLGNDPKFYMLRNADIAEAFNEIKRLTDEVQGHLVAWDIEHADNARLRSALSDMLKHFKQYEDAECCKRVYAQAHRALENKP